MVLLSLSVSSPFLFFPHFKPQSEKEDGPVTAAKFYGAVAPAISLKIMQGPRPSLKEAFSGTASNEQTTQQIPKKNTRGKKCTAHFGCSNVAVSQEPQSGTLYCRDHKPKQVLVEPINLHDRKAAAKRK